MILMRKLVAILLLVIPLASAGTPEDPEIADSQGDLELHPDYGAVNVARPEIDILKIWLERSEEEVRVNFIVLDLGEETLSDQYLGFSLSSLADDGTEFYVQVTRDPAGRWSFVAVRAPRGGEQSYEEVAGYVDPTTGLISAAVPSAFFPPPAAVLRGSSIIYTAGPLGDLPKTVWFRDWAPDAGASREKFSEGPEEGEPANTVPDQAEETISRQRETPSAPIGFAASTLCVLALALARRAPR